MFSNWAANNVQIGDCVRVEGTAGEYNGLTQISGSVVVTEYEGCAPVVPTALATLPETDAEKEAYEGMLVRPQGTYTITNNYGLNQYGQLGLAFGDEPLYQATDVVTPGDEAAAYETANLAKLITLDDGSSWNYVTNATAKNSPLPYLSADEPMRTASQVTFAKPVILDYRFQWNYQPVDQIVGATDPNDPVVSENDREYTVPNVGGDLEIAAFNVLNYFTDLGVNETGCKAYTDMYGNPVGANNCEVRGAYSESAFADQQAKIVAAINKMDAEVVALMEIENSAGVSYIDHARDHTLAQLVDALNADAGTTRWAYAPTPTVTPSNEDIIRTAFLYDPSVVELVGPSFIDLDEAFANARYPLAQEFAVLDSPTTFVTVANHFKSKGSGEDDGTGQGLSNPSREAQSRQLVAWVDEMFAGKAAFLMGDFNAYSKETPVQIIEAAGYTNTAKHFAPDSATYQFSGRLGSLDHVFANEEAMALVTGAAVWDINGDESIAFQYSRRNYNTVDFHSDDEFASSDHDPVIVGLKPAAPAADPVLVTATGFDCNSFGFSVTGAPEGAKLHIEWERGGQKQFTTVNSLTWWSGDRQAGWSNAVATVLDADENVLATSGDPINPDSCPMITTQRVSDKAFGFVVDLMPKGSTLKITWTDRKGKTQVRTTTQSSWWSGNSNKGWEDAQAVLLDANGEVIAESAVINYPL